LVKNTFYISVATPLPTLQKKLLAQFLEKTRTLRNLRQTCPRQRRTPLINKQIRREQIFFPKLLHIMWYDKVNHIAPNIEIAPI
jgi:hypothetical protein